MRLRVSIRNEQRELPLQYRRVFLSLLKKALEQRGLLYLLSRKQVRPYVFTVYLGRSMRIHKERGVFQTGETLSLRFSTGDPLLGAEILTGLASLKDRVFQYETYSLVVERVEALPEAHIRTPRVRFRTLGIAVLTDPGKDAHDRDQWFVLPGDRRFSEVFAIRARERYRLILGSPYNGPLQISMRRWKADHAHHYEGVRGFRGTLDVEARPEMLQFLYQYGIGVRTGQGFGFVDLAGGTA